MSSILDALRKLEQEQGDAAAKNRGGLEPEVVERDTLTGRASGKGAVTISIEPSMILMGSLVVAALIVAGAGGTFWYVMQNGASNAPIVAATPDPVKGVQLPGQPSEPPPAVFAAESAPPAAEQPETATPTPEPEPVSPASTVQPATTAPIEVEAPVKVQSAAETPMPAVQSSAAEPEPVEPERPSPPPVEAERTQVAKVDPPAPTVPQPRDPAPAPETTPPEAETHAEPMPQAPLPPQDTTIEEDAPVGEIDLNTLPILSESDRVRLGLPEITINIVGTASARNPRPSAMINYKRVMVGEYIPGTNAKLIAVDVKGIGVSVGGSQFFVAKR